MNAIMSYLRGSVEELHQVRWPTRQQAIRLSVIVLGFIIVNSIILGVIDVILTEAVTLLLA